MTETEHPCFAVTVDLVVVTFHKGELAVVLVRRNEAPFAGSWALPGGFKRPDETLDDAALRELAEETNLERPGEMFQFGAFGDPGRDPRTNVVTVSYLVATNPSALDGLRAGGDAADVTLMPVAAVRSGAVPLAFDHHVILEGALQALATRLEYSGVAPKLLDESFTLVSLRRVYEQLWGHELNPANFRRALMVGQKSGESSSDTEPSAKIRDILTSLSRSDLVTRDDSDGATALRVSAHESRAVHVESVSPRLVASSAVGSDLDSRLLRAVSKEVPAGTAAGVIWELLSSIKPVIPFVVPVGDPETGELGDRYRATVAWDLQPAPIRRPRSRRSSGRADAE